jgi:uncharacterized membrane protein
MVNVVQGGCNPAPLKRAVEGDQVVIQVNDILDEARPTSIFPKRGKIDATGRHFT